MDAPKDNQNTENGVIRVRGVRCTGPDKAEGQREGLVFIYLHRRKTLRSAVLKRDESSTLRGRGSHTTLVSYHGAPFPIKTT